ncbi:manganese transporter [Halalkalibacillus sediminis]|uniref:Manganese transporter n=1 Tax=Halalkalibacillus sediminis TaxID=2018042 RepID=A0A2I0QYA1_9BACI|nr:zinc ABC transporter substrate-binding protein [Halalkalibacillus sediminis]PKR79312.1 manganese transporter [Halalkalibacillus sediminis]
MKKIYQLLLLFTFILLVAAGCSNQEGEATDEDTINIVTTIAQIGEPLSVIGGDRVNVESLMGPSVDPHLYNATHGDIKKVDQADLIFYNGLNLEANMVKVFDEISQTRPVLAIGETVPKDQLLEDEEGSIDPHIWFDIDLWREALDSAVEELKEYSPEDAEYFEQNKQDYFSELEKLKEDSLNKMSEIPESKRVLVTAHDAFGYFGNMYNLDVIGLQGLSTDGEIGVSDINNTISIIKKYEIPAIFVETSINEDSIQAVIQGASSDGIDVSLGGELFSDAMGQAETIEGTYLGMYRHNVETISKALTEGDD